MDETLLTARFGLVGASEIRTMWTRAIEGIDAFLSVNESVQWNCEEIHIPFNNIEDTTLISILSEMETPADGHDYLFLIINDLILRYNNFTKSLGLISSSGVHEIHPRTLVRLSKNTTSVIGTVSGVQHVMDGLVESYWSQDDNNFKLLDLLRAIRIEIRMIGKHQPIKSPVSFLREKFSFREDHADSNSTQCANKACFRSSDGLYFARNADVSLYEEVLDIANEMGFVKGTAILHSLIVTFLTFSYTEWLSLLEGVRNALDHLNGALFTSGNAQLGQVIINFERFGFPPLDEAQSNLLKSLHASDLMEVICMCGEQLATEAYRYVGLPSRLAEPLPVEVKNLIRDAIANNSSVAEIEAFSADVLEFYCDRLIVPASESSNQGMATFLRENNCCDDTDTIFGIIPESVSIRNYIDVQKMLYQAKLRLISSENRHHIVQPACSSDEVHVSHLKPSRWKWSSNPKSHEQKYQWSAFGGNLWFEEALMKGNTNAADSQDDAYSRCSLNADCIEIATSDHDPSEDGVSIQDNASVQNEVIAVTPIDDAGPQNDDTLFHAESSKQLESNNIITFSAQEEEQYEHAQL